MRTEPRNPTRASRAMETARDIAVGTLTATLWIGPVILFWGAVIVLLTLA